jgi:hypothetical protein
MEVRDIFQLRKDGKIEEAYAAIRPMYAQHKGHYTTICMFWVASDILHKRLDAGQQNEAAAIFNALCRLYPTMDDSDGKGRQAILRAALALSEKMDDFSMLDFLQTWDVEQLSEDDWKGATANGHPLPSLGQRIVSRVFHEVSEKPTVENALKETPLLKVALQQGRYQLTTQRLLALNYQIMGEREKAAAVYRQLLQRHHQSYLYSELAALTDDPQETICLLGKALLTQRDEKFCVTTRLQLALLLERSAPRRARYEADKCIATRQAAGYKIPVALQQLVTRLQNVVPVSEQEERAFY